MGLLAISLAMHPCMHVMVIPGIQWPTGPGVQLHLHVRERMPLPVHPAVCQTHLPRPDSEALVAVAA